MATDQNSKPTSWFKWPWTKTPPAPLPMAPFRKADCTVVAQFHQYHPAVAISHLEKAYGLTYEEASEAFKEAIIQHFYIMGYQYPD